MAVYHWLNVYRTRLAKGVSAQERMLPVADAAVLAGRIADGFTFLAIDDGTGAVEVVKVEPFGNELKMTRGQEGTAARAYPAGACVFWVPVRESVAAGADKAGGDCDCKDGKNGRLDNAVVAGSL